VLKSGELMDDSSNTLYDICMYFMAAAIGEGHKMGRRFLLLLSSISSAENRSWKTADVPSFI
jgi:hypothetical protein